jgi:apolipoprotein D and lipocalin family protein
MKQRGQVFLIIQKIIVHAENRQLMVDSSQQKWVYDIVMKKPHRLNSLFGLVGLIAFMTACSTENDPSLKPMPVVASVDVAQYLGTWHQVAWIPNSFQSDCATDTKATYTLDGADLRVQNQCKDVNGKTTEAIGIAKIVEGSNNAKLRVSFFRPFYGNYWILALDPDYKWVLVGEPKRTYGWVLARETTLDAATLNQILDHAVTQGYDRNAFKMSPSSLSK